MLAEKETQVATEPWFDQLMERLKQKFNRTGAPSSIMTYSPEPYSEEFPEFTEANDKIRQRKLLSTEYFVTNMISDYLILLKTVCTPKKLAFDYTSSEVFVWAEIEDDNETAEQELYLLEAKINSKYHQCGFDLSSMVVETQDNLSIPHNYILFY